MRKYYTKLLIVIFLFTAFSFQGAAALAEGEHLIIGKSGKPVKPERMAFQESVSFSFAGDVILESKIANLIDKYGRDYIFSDVKQFFKAADISVLNLETPVSTRGTKEKDKQFTFRANPKHLPILREADIDIVSLANNHCLDFGRDALKDTFSGLKKEGLLYAGAGENLEQASNPVFVERKDSKIAILASSRVIPFGSWYATAKNPGVASTYNPEIIKKEIAEARKTADIVVVYVHWGKERAEIPEKYQRDLARAYIDSGADMVIGSHPHVLQGLEFYKGKLIAYSLGNFVFTDLKKDTMVLNVTVENKVIKDVKIIPCEITAYRPLVVKDRKRMQEIVDKMKKLSFNTVIDAQGNASAADAKK